MAQTEYNSPEPDLADAVRNQRRAGISFIQKFSTSWKNLSST